MGEFVEIRLRHAPKGLREALSAEARERGITLEAYALTILWDRNGTKAGLTWDKNGTGTGRKREKFIPPTEQEVNALIVTEGYHVSAREFVAHYRRQRWKLGNGRPMGDWKDTVVTWEENWKEKHQGDGQGAAVGRQEYDTSGNEALVKAIKEGKGW